MERLYSLLKFVVLTASKKLFLNYNRNIKRHKFYLGFRLHEYNLIDKGIFSFSNKHFDDV